MLTPMRKTKLRGKRRRLFHLFQKALEDHGVRYYIHLNGTAITVNGEWLRFRFACNACGIELIHSPHTPLRKMPWDTYWCHTWGVQFGRADHISDKYAWDYDRVSASLYFDSKGGWSWLYHKQ